MREVVVSENERPAFKISEVVLFWETASPKYGHGRWVAEWRRSLEMRRLRNRVWEKVTHINVEII